MFDPICKGLDPHSLMMTVKALRGIHIFAFINLVTMACRHQDLAHTESSPSGDVATLIYILAESGPIWSIFSEVRRIVPLLTQ